MMTRPVLEHTDTVEVCEDCYLLEGTGDATFLDAHYDPGEADNRWDEISEGLAELRREGHIHMGESMGFSMMSCDCCGSTLGGERFELLIFNWSEE